MSPLPYRDEHRIFRASVRRFLEREVVPNIRAWEDEGLVPRSAWRRMGEQGFLCTDVPEAYGGVGGDFLYAVVVAEELGRIAFTGLAAPLHSDIVVPYLTAFGSDLLKRRLLPGCVRGELIAAVAMTEPDAGSDLAAIRTRVEQQGDQLVLNGAKTFISNGAEADVVIVAARDPAVAEPHAAIDLVVVEAGTPGFSRGKRLDKIGWRANDTAELFFDDCRVPVGNRLGQKGAGFRMLMDKLKQERLMVALIAVATAEAILEQTVAYVKERRAFGQPLSAFQNTRFRLAEAATEVRVGRAFLDKLIVDHLAGAATVEEVSMAKYWCADAAMRAVDGCLQLHGGYGYTEEYPVARAWRDLRVLSIFAGTNEIMKTIIAKQLGL